MARNACTSGREGGVRSSNTTMRVGEIFVLAFKVGIRLGLSRLESQEYAEGVVEARKVTNILDKDIRA